MGHPMVFEWDTFHVAKLKAITYQTFTFATYSPSTLPHTFPLLPSPPPPTDAINVTKATFAFDCFLKKIQNAIIYCSQTRYST